MKFIPTKEVTTTTRNAATTIIMVEAPIDVFVVVVLVAVISKAVVAETIVEVEDTTVDAMVANNTTMEETTTAIAIAMTVVNPRCNLTIPAPYMAFTNGASAFLIPNATLMLHRTTAKKATIRTMCLQDLS